MADYYSLLAKLLEGLPDPSSEVREGIYDRARRALAEQLKTVEPPLTPAEIAREQRSLEDAIARLEGTLPEGPAGRLPVASGMGIQAKAEEAEEPPLDLGAPVRRPETVAIRRGGRKQRPSAILLVLVLLAIPVAVLAFLWRDRPPPAPEVAQAPAAPAPVQADLKYGERVGGSQPLARASPPQAPAPSAPAAPAPAASAPTTAPTAEARPPQAPAAASPGPSQDLAIAQRALFFEENPAEPGNPSMKTGRAVWRLDALNAGQGQPLETVIRGGLDIPGAGLTLTIVIRRNLDAALPASHTMELTFATAPTPSGPARTVRDVALPMMRLEETVRGIAVAGLPVPVKENVFLIGLSDLRGDVERNTELLLRRNWVELPIRFSNGQKAVLLFDKGVSGERVFLDAFRQWGQAP